MPELNTAYEGENSNEEDSSDGMLKWLVGLIMLVVVCGGGYYGYQYVRSEKDDENEQPNEEGLDNPENGEMGFEEQEFEGSLVEKKLPAKKKTYKKKKRSLKTSDQSSKNQPASSRIGQALADTKSVIVRGLVEKFQAVFGDKTKKKEVLEARKSISSRKRSRITADTDSLSIPAAAQSSLPSSIPAAQQSSLPESIPAANQSPINGTHGSLALQSSTSSSISNKKVMVVDGAQQLRLLKERRERERREKEMR